MTANRKPVLRTNDKPVLDLRFANCDLRRLGRNDPVGAPVSDPAGSNVFVQPPKEPILTAPRLNYFSYPAISVGEPEAGLQYVFTRYFVDLPGFARGHLFPART